MRFLVVLYRAGHWSYRRRIPFIPKLTRWIIRFLYAADVPSETTIGAGVHFSHMGLGVVLHERAVIGDHVYIGHHVTIGGRSGYQDLPVIKNRVMIGAGAQILGPVTVGEGVNIGASSLVLDSIPDRCVAAGIPAKVISHGKNQEEIYGKSAAEYYNQLKNRKR
jgi:serine O-acetyltransferase